MPFIPVTLAEDHSGGNFSVARRTFFNKCGNEHYEGSLSFRDAMRARRVIPIFNDECLRDDAPDTYKLLKHLRKGIQSHSRPLHILHFKDNHRSIHQNENGYLPYSSENAPSASCFAPAIAAVAKLHGQLPNNQAQAGARTRGQFLEYTCQDEMHVDCRLIVDYRFGFIYMTFGHYHRDSFALMVRSTAELRYELTPTLPIISASYDA